jgi:replicative DNA helicase
MSDILQSSAGGPPGLTPPQALDAERSILAAMLLDESAIGRAVEMIEASAFYRTAHAKLYEAIVALYNTSTPADLITVSEKLRERGDLEAVGGRRSWRRSWSTRRPRRTSSSTSRSCTPRRSCVSSSRPRPRSSRTRTRAGEETADILDRAEARIFGITDQRIREGFVTVGQLLKPTFDNIQKLFERKVQITGVPSGWDDLDKLTSGWQPGDLVILAGRPRWESACRGARSSWTPTPVNASLSKRPIRRRQPASMVSMTRASSSSRVSVIGSTVGSSPASVSRRVSAAISR